MLSGLRAEIQHLLYAVPAGRKPALRRASTTEDLFATDLPLVAVPQAVEAFLEAMHKAGWQHRLHNGWICLDAPVPVPASVMPSRLMGECGCCIAILERHAGEVSLAENEIRRLVKAVDAGVQPFERECASLHGELAVRLRMHQPLPVALLPYLRYAHERFYK